MSTTKSLSLRETADTTRRVSAPPAASLNDPSGLKIDSSECDADKECAKWKANYLKHREARAQYEALDKNTNLLVKLKWDPKASESVTNGYKWNASGELTNATVTLAAKTGHVGKALDPAAGYVYGSKIRTDPLRQAYVFAHEFGHVEQAEEPDISRLYNWMNVQGERLRQAEGSFGVGKYSALPWTGPLQYELDQLGLALEKSAD